MIGRGLSNLQYERLALEQGSTEWHRFRRTVIGASDAPTIMGENPWKSVAALLKDKRGEGGAYVGNAAMRRGTALEPVARSLYVKERHVEVMPAVLRSNIFEWQAASVDGIDAIGSVVVEIKCGEKAYEWVRQTSRVPKYYYGQLQHILSVTGLKQIDYFSYWPGCRGILLTVERDEAYIERMLELEERFWRRLVGTDSPPLSRNRVATSTPEITEESPVSKTATESPEDRWTVSEWQRRRQAAEGEHAGSIPWWVWILGALFIAKLFLATRIRM